MIVLKCSFVCWLAISTFAGVASGNSADTTDSRATTMPSATTETLTSTPTAQPQTSANQADITTITGADQSTVKPSGLTSALTTGPTTETGASNQGTSTIVPNFSSTSSETGYLTDLVTTDAHRSESGTMSPTPGANGTTAVPGNSAGTGTPLTTGTRIPPSTAHSTVTSVQSTDHTVEPGIIHTTVHPTQPPSTFLPATTETFTSTPTAQPQTSANQADVTTITGADQSTVKPSGLTSAMTTGPTTETVASDQGTSTPGANGISTATNNSTGTDNTAITMTQTSHTTPSSTVTQSLSASIPVLPTNQTESPDTTYTTVQPTSHSSSHPGTTGTSAAPDNSTGTDTLTTNVTQTSPTTPSRTVTQSVSASTPVLPTNSTEDPGTTYTTVHSTAPSSSTPGTNWTPSSPDSTIRTDSTPPNGTQTSHTSSPSTVTHPMNDSTPVRPTNQTASTDGNQTTVQSTPPSTSPPDYCSSNPCPFSSTCVGLFKNYTCQCVPGYYYTLRGCVEGKVFPGVLHLTKMTYKTDMSNISSKLFNETATTITEVLREILEKQEGYVESVVQKLESGSVVATVQNIYDISSNVNEKTVNSAILNKIQSCNVICGVFDGAEYQAKSLCDLNVCDPISTDCHSTDGTANCKCKPGYRELIYTNKSCGVCPSGYKASGTNCVKCPFGYSGFNCDESYLLAVVVISCVLGGLLVIVTLAFCCFCCRSSKDSSYRSPYPAEDSLTWPKQEVPRIPRASTNWDHPQMEMSENGSTHVLVNKPQQGNGVDESYDLDIDDMKTFKGKNQSRYSYLCHGQENPYFVADDDKKASK